jgi:hypothetical protein
MRHGTLLIGAALLLAACDSSTTASGPQAGGEDFPNTVNALGRTLALGMDSTKDWNGLDSASTDAGTGSSPLEDLGATFAGRSLGVICTDDSASGIDGSRAFFQKTTCIPGTLAGTVKDSLVIAYYPGITEALIDTVYWWSMDTLRPLNGYESYTWIQPYSRNFLLVKGDTGRVKFNVRRTASKWTDLTEMIADGGRDHIIGTGDDNTYWQATRSLVKNATSAPDTSWALWIVPGEAGKPVIGTSDSGLTRVTKQTKLALGRRVESGLLMAHRDTLRNYAKLWSAKTDWNFGLTRWQTAFGPASDSTFKARDTVRLLDRYKKSNGTDSTRTEVKAILGPSLAQHDKDSVMSIRFERNRTGQNERHTLWEIQSDNPVANGSESKSGSIYAHVDFADGGYAQFHGKWSEQLFTGTWSNGKDSATVVVKRDGTVQSMTKL